jgi:WD40 repeat protein
VSEQNPDRIADLLRALDLAGLDYTARDIAEAYWLSLRMATGAATEEPSGARDVLPPLKKTQTGTEADERGSAVIPPVTPVTHPVVDRSFAIQIARTGPDLPPSGPPLEIPAPSALPARSAVVRALRPLMARAPSRSRRTIDVEATARRRAEERILEPVFVPARDRWLDTALVLDIGASMDVWRPTLIDLRKVLEQMSGFHRVRSWQLLTDQEEPLIRDALRWGEPGAAAPVGSRPARRPLEIIETNGRSLVLIVTDCVSPAWYGPSLQSLLAQWSRAGAVAILQVLPRRLWQRTAMGMGRSGKVQSGGSGAFDRRWIWEPDWKPLDDPPACVPVPVATLSHDDLIDLALLLSGRGGVRVHGTWLEPAVHEAEETPASVSGKELVREFQRTAAKAARRLASLLAAAPVINLPVIRLLSEAAEMQPAPCQPESVAEVWLAGLLRADPRTADAPDPDDVFYEFPDDVRDALLDALPRPDARDVLEKVSEYVERNLGRMRGLTAFLANPEQGQGLFAPGDTPFAEVASHVLRRLGGDYARLVDSVAGPSATGAAEAGPIRILHLSDLRFDPDKPLSPALKAVVFATHEWVRAGKRPDFVVIAGNLVDSGKRRAAFQIARRWIEQELLPILPGQDPRRVIVVSGAFEISSVASDLQEAAIDPGELFRDFANAFCPFPDYPAGGVTFSVGGQKVGFARICPTSIVGMEFGFSVEDRVGFSYTIERVETTFEPLWGADVRVAILNFAWYLTPSETRAELEEALRKTDTPLLLSGSIMATRSDARWASGAAIGVNGHRTVSLTLRQRPEEPIDASISVGLVEIDPSGFWVDYHARNCRASDSDPSQIVGDVHLTRLPLYQVAPEREDIVKLPSSAIAAFAARCVRRVLPLLDRYPWSPGWEHNPSLVARAVEEVEQSAAEPQFLVSLARPDLDVALEELTRALRAEASPTTAPAPRQAVEADLRPGVRIQVDSDPFEHPLPRIGVITATRHWIPSTRGPYQVIVEFVEDGGQPGSAVLGEDFITIAVEGATAAGQPEPMIPDPLRRVLCVIDAARYARLTLPGARAQRQHTSDRPSTPPGRFEDIAQSEGNPASSSSSQAAIDALEQARLAVPEGAQEAFTQAVAFDFHKLLQAARKHGWKDSQPVPPSFFGEVWPSAPPAGWLEPAPQPAVTVPPGFALEHMLSSHPGAINCITWSPDGRFLASGLDDGTFCIYSVETGQPVLKFAGDIKPTSLAWSPDGRSLATSGGTDGIRLWDVQTASALHTLPGHTGNVHSLAWSPDGLTLASGSSDNTIRIWNVRTAEPLRTLTAHSDRVCSLAWSPAGALFASGSFDRRILLWDGDPRQVIREFSGHTDNVLSVAWSPDGRTFASGSRDSTIRIWDVRARRDTIVLRGHTQSVKSVSYSWDGRLLASKSADNTVRLRRCDNWTPVAQLEEPAPSDSAANLAFHPTGDLLATIDETSTSIHVWRLDTATLLGASKTGSGPELASVSQGNEIDPDYTSREGYNPEHLGTGDRRVPLPRMTREMIADAAISNMPLPGRRAYELVYHHFSVVLNKKRRLAYFAAVNIDGRALRSVVRGQDRWLLDPRVSPEEQAGADLYRPSFDRGRLVRRLDPAWGESVAIASTASYDTLHFTNCIPMHNWFNVSKNLWRGLADYLRDKAENEHRRMIVFSGPIFRQDDPFVNGFQIPLEFWKVAVIARREAPLVALGFLASQMELVIPRGEESEPAAETTTYFPVAVRLIERRTGLDFGRLREYDSIEASDAAQRPAVADDESEDRDDLEMA